MFLVNGGLQYLLVPNCEDSNAEALPNVLGHDCPQVLVYQHGLLVVEESLDGWVGYRWVCKKVALVESALLGSSPLTAFLSNSRLFLFLWALAFGFSTLRC